ncbi:metallophosphoesterase family protein [Corynebacterium mayonis]|uniref:metallophosphoesterase family protein n=1 Tax=Corynebacterium mayonis TaxID=3062461 RepID=UPI00314035AB
MSAVTFIHTSDLQLGMTRKFLSAEAQSRFDDARLAAVAALGRLATSRGAEFIVVAGDVFEHNSLEKQTRGRALEALKALPVPVYLLPGNHDPLVADSMFMDTQVVDSVHVLDSFEPVTVREGVEIVGAPLTAKFASEDLVAKALRPLGPTEAVRIAVGHGQVETRMGEPAVDTIDLTNVEAKLADATIDYLALGDTHSTRQLGASGKVWFSGSPETTDFHDRRLGAAGNETDSGNALVVTLDKGQVEVEKVHVGTWVFDALHWEVTEDADVDRILEQLQAYPDKARTVVKYSIDGTLGLAATQRLEQGIADVEPVFAALYERDRLMNLHLEPSEEELADLPLSGFARATLDELLSTADSQPSRDAINLLFRLSKED